MVYRLMILLALLGSCGVLGASAPRELYGYWVEDPAGAPVIDRGPVGAWDHKAVDNPTFLRHKGETYILFEAEDESGHEQVGLATSVNFRHWRKHPGNPILPVGPEGAIDSLAAKIPIGFSMGDAAMMLYTAKDGATARVGAAVSDDLVTWRKVPHNPVLNGRPGTWEPVITTCPALVRHDGLWYTIYRGMTGFYREQQLGIAVSSDGVAWQRAGIGPQLPDVYSFAVSPARLGGRWWAAAQEAGINHYYTSDDLMAWERGPIMHLGGIGIETMSQPWRHDGEWWMVYEKQDRIYRARLTAALRLPLDQDLRSPKRVRQQWQPIEGNWSAGTDGYACALSGAWSRASLAVAPARDITVEARASLEEGTGWIGVALDCEDGLCAFAVVHDGRDIARLFRSASGRPGEVEWVIDAPFAPHAERPYDFRVTRHGATVACYVDGKLVLRRTDPEPLSLGPPGLFATGAGARFTRFAVRAERP